MAGKVDETPVSPLPRAKGQVKPFPRPWGAPRSFIGYHVLGWLIVLGTLAGVASALWLH